MLHEDKLFGIIPILLTPFLESGAVDEESFRREVRFCLKAGAHGIVVPGMASEVFYLTEVERVRLVEISLEEVEGRIPVIAGVYGESVERALESSKGLARLGIDAALVNAPHFCTASDTYLERHFGEISSVLNVPIVLQNYPLPYGEALSAGQVRKLIERCENIVYVKEETEPPGHHITELLKECGSTGKLRGVFGGKTGRWMLDELSRGACGNMPAAAWIDIHVKVFNLYTNGRENEARELHGSMMQSIMPYQSLGRGYAKEILRLRGVFRTRVTRAPQLIALDEFDLRETGEIYKKAPFCVGAELSDA